MKRFLSAAGLIALVLAGLPAGVSAASSYRPDARIKYVCAGVAEWRMCDPKLVGDDVYNAGANGQRRTWHDYFDYSTEPDPRRVSFKISMQNDGRRTDRFTVSADGITNGYRVAFFNGTTNVTAAVEAGTYVTPRIAAGGTFVITARVVMNCDPSEYCDQDRASRLVTIGSTGNPALVDAVRFVRMRWVCSC